MKDMQRADVPLVEIVDRLLDRGVVLAGGAGISVAGVDLIELRLNVVLAGTDRFARSLAPRHELTLLLTLRWRVPRATPAEGGANYLRARAAEQREAQQIVERLLAQLAIERALIRERICPQRGIAATVEIETGLERELSVRRSVEQFAHTADEVAISIARITPQ